MGIGVLVSSVLTAGAGETTLSQSLRSDPRTRILASLDLLAQTSTGKALLEKAVRFWGLSEPRELKKYIIPGRVSRTDAVLTRHYQPDTGKEVRERSVKVILRLDQSLSESALDLAHELTHATSQPSWDPYDPGLTVGRYIHAALESEGGEIDAVEHECKTAREFVVQLGLRVSRCDRYIKGSSVERVAIQKDFYRVGESLRDVKSKLRDECQLFPNLSSDEPELYSATGGAPYPVALIREYEELNRVACENMRKREQTEESGRSPASLSMLRARCQETHGYSSTRTTPNQNTTED